MSARFGKGNPLDTCWIGNIINQEDYPWWAVQALRWVSMVQSMMEAEGEVGHAARASLQLVLAGRFPLSKIPEIYADLVSAAS